MNFGHLKLRSQIEENWSQMSNFEIKEITVQVIQMWCANLVILEKTLDGEKCNDFNVAIKSK